jgi:hypothetical protein
MHLFVDHSIDLHHIRMPSIICIVSLLFALINVFQPGHCADATNRTYLIKKDLMSGIKGGEFTVYDSTGKNLQYRMESKFGVTHDVHVYRMPAKTLVARLKAKVTVAMYKAALTILDQGTNRWNNGTIEQNFKIVGNKFTIVWNGEKISMQGTAASLDTAFVAQTAGDLLGKFHKRVSSLFWRNKYDLQVLSNKYPDALYFLGVASRDHANMKIHRG